MHVLAVGGEGYRVTAQMVLVCCWRTMKEVAMLLGQLCQSLPLHYTNDNVCTHTGLITEQQVRPQTKHTNAYTPRILLLHLSHTQQRVVQHVRYITVVENMKIKLF